MSLRGSLGTNLSGLTGLAADDLVDVLDALPLVWLRLAEGADLCGDLADELLVCAENGDLRLAVHLKGDAGWRIDEVESPPFREPARLQAQLWLAEMARGATAAFAAEDDPDANHVLAEMHKLTAVPDLNGVLDALQARVGFVREWQMFLEKYPVLICPISSEPPFPDLLDLEDFPRVIEAQLTQVGLPLLGLPGMSVFTGFGESDMGRVPLGAQLIGGRYREDILLDAAEAIEARGEAIKVVTP